MVRSHPAPALPQTYKPEKQMTKRKCKCPPDSPDDEKDNERPLTQEELKAWWPFTRLDPKRFPKTQHEPEKFEEAPF